MTTNSINKPRTESEVLNKSGSIRTDYILPNLCSYMIRDVCRFDAPANKDEEELLGEIKKIVDDFKLDNGQNIQVLCSELIVTADKLDSILYGVTNELFVEGYTWSKIIAFFVFVSILTDQDNISKDILYEKFCRLVKEILVPWIEDHGGWEGVLCLKDDKPSGWSWRNIHVALSKLVHLANFPANI